MRFSMIFRYCYFTPVIFALLMIGCSTWLRWPLWESAYFSDGSPLSWLTSVQIYSASILTVQLLINRKISVNLALWMIFSMSYLCLDEQFMLHEQWKYGCYTLTSFCKYTLIREMASLLIVCLGLPTLYLLYQRSNHLLPRRLLLTSAVVAVFSSVVDLVPEFSLFLPIEEGLEVISSAFFLSSLLQIGQVNRD